MVVETVEEEAAATVVADITIREVAVMKNESNMTFSALSPTRRELPIRVVGIRAWFLISSNPHPGQTETEMRPVTILDEEEGIRRQCRERSQ